MQIEKLILYAVVGIAAAKWARNEGLLSDPEDQTGSLLDLIPETVEDVQNKFMTDQIDEQTAAQNVAAFLHVIRIAEGTSQESGYRALFGYTPNNGKTFSSFADHPRQFFLYEDLAGKTIRTSAAGAYQITATTYNALCSKYGFAAFTPDVQDAMALTLIDERGALGDVRAGRFDLALSKVRKVWASLPNSGVNQPTRKIEQLQAAYLNAGGVFA